MQTPSFLPHCLLVLVVLFLYLRRIQYSNEISFSVETEEEIAFQRAKFISLKYCLVQFFNVI